MSTPSQPTFLDFKSAAEKGNPSAMNNLGLCYANGAGVKQDLSEAVKWYQEAANKGNPAAMFNLALCYDYGEGVEKNLNEAFRWYEAAAAKDNLLAMNNLGLHYKHGEGVKQDLGKAFGLFLRAAEKDNPGAMYNLARCYANGTGVKQDLNEAVKWYQEAADKGFSTAIDSLANLISNGSPTLINTIGIYYADGKGVKQDWTKAAKWFQAASNKGNQNAMYNLACCYETGNGFPTSNYEEAVKYYKMAAAAGVLQAQERLKNITTSDKLYPAHVKVYSQEYNEEKKQFPQPHITPQGGTVSGVKIRSTQAISDPEADMQVLCSTLSPHTTQDILRNIK